MAAPHPDDLSRFPVVKIALLIGVSVVVVALFASGTLDGFSLERTVATIRAYGAWGVLVYLLAFTFLQPLGPSGHLFTVVAGLVWPVWLALPLALVGALGSAAMNVAFARYVAFDWVQARIPPRVRRGQKWVTERGLLGVILFRLATFTMHPAQLLMGVIPMPLSRLFVGTALGFAPSVAAGVLLGGEVTRWLAAALGLG